MSPNLEFLRGLYAAWDRGDYRAVDWADPDIESAFADGPNPGRWRGDPRDGRRLGRGDRRVRRARRPVAGGRVETASRGRAWYQPCVTSANCELVRAIYSSWELGDFTLVDWADPDIEFVLADGPNPGTWTGLAAMSRAWGSTLAAFDDLRASAEECRDLDDERVLVLTQNSGRGKISGFDLAAMETRGANVFHVRGGRVTKLVAYFNRERALADLGLETQTA